jgi:hypothetical protein
MARRLVSAATRTFGARVSCLDCTGVREDDEPPHLLAHLAPLGHGTYRAHPLETEE